MGKERIFEIIETHKRNCDKSGDVIGLIALKLLEKDLKSEFEGNDFVSWSVEDFNCQAQNSEDPSIYDETLFEDALQQMIDNHDASIGITWDTVNYYLNEYCKKEEEE